MNKLLTKIVGAALGLSMTVGVGVAVASNEKSFARTEAAESTITSAFTSKSWASSDSLWNSDKDGSATDARGISVQAAATGAGATTKTSYSNVSAISIWLSKSNKGVGSVNLKVGSTTVLTQSSFTTSSTKYDGTISSTLTGKISFVVTCTTSTIYVEKVQWTYDDGGGAATNYTLTYAAGTHGTYDGTTTKSFEVAENTSATLKTPSEVGISANSGYTFNGWNDGEDTYAAGASYPMGTSNHTLTAQWIEATSYILVTDASTLVAGTTFILLHESEAKAAGAMSSGIFPMVSASVSGSSATSASATVFTLGGSSSAWTIQENDVYLGKTSSSGTSFETSATVVTGYHWTISIASNKATLKTESSGTRAIAYNYNNGSDRLGAYTPSDTYTLPRMFAIIPQVEEYDITTSISHGSASGDSTIVDGGTATVTITPDTGYKLPATISVTGASYTYDSTTGVVSLSSPTDDVAISATMVVATQYTISTSLTGLTASGDSTIYENGTATVTLAVVDSSTKALPLSIEVTNANSYTYNSNTGVVTINGASGNVTITAAAIAKPAEESEEFTFPDGGSGWTATGSTNGGYTKTVDLITVAYNKTNGYNDFYWNPARFYTNMKIDISATTGAGAVITIKSVTFYATATGNYLTAWTSATTSDVVGGGSIASQTSDNSTVSATFTTSGTVTSFSIVPQQQSRVNKIEVVYEKDQSDVPLQSITATCPSVLVSQQVSPLITFNPAGATNKKVSYEIVEGTSSLAEVSANGVVTGLGAGTARLKITPEDTNASAITIDVVVSALPTIHGVEVGNKYAITSNGYELTAFNAGNYGESTALVDDPSNSFPVRVVNGLYARTVALEVTVSGDTKYLSYDSNGGANSLNVVDSITRESSWIFAEVDSELQIRNVEVYSRIFCFYGAPTYRFACFPEATATSSSCFALSFVEIVEAKTAKEHVQDFVDLYMHMTDYTGDGTGRCNDGEYAYYLTAKAGYNVMVRPYSDRASLFASDSDFAAAKARYERWAEFNNDADPYDGYDEVHTKIHESRVIGTTNNSVAAIISIIAVLSLSAVVGFFMLRKRKEQ